MLKGKNLDHKGSMKHYVPVPRQFPIEYVPELGALNNLPDELTLGTTNMA